MVIALGLSRWSQNILPQCLRVFRHMSVGRLVGRMIFLCMRNSMSFHGMSTSFRMSSMIFHSMGTIFHENSMNKRMLNRFSCRMLVGTRWEEVL